MSQVLALKSGEKRPFDDMNVDSQATLSPGNYNCHASYNLTNCHQGASQLVAASHSSLPNTKRYRASAWRKENVASSSSSSSETESEISSSADVTCASETKAEVTAKFRLLSQEKKTSTLRSREKTDHVVKTLDGEALRKIDEIIIKYLSKAKKKMLVQQTDSPIPSQTKHVAVEASVSSACFLNERSPIYRNDKAKSIGPNLDHLPAPSSAKANDKLFTLNNIRNLVSSALTDYESRTNEEFSRILQEKLGEQFRTFTKFNEDYVSRYYRQKDYNYFS